MLAPKKLQHRKQHRPNAVGIAKGNLTVAFGKFALKAVSGGWVKSKQIEASRRVLTRFVKKGGKIWIRVFPHRPITAKGSQSTMGGGKGAPEYYVSLVKPGTVIFEMDGIKPEEAKQAMLLAADKLPVKTIFITKD